MKPIKPHSTADIINGRQCMEILHIASKTLFVCMRRRGDIPFHTYGDGRSKRVFYYRSEIEALLRPAHLNLPSNNKTHDEPTNAETMSSLQIAELTGKRHDAILRDIRNLLEQGVNAHNFVAVEYTDAKGEKRPCYNLTKKGCLILASGYNAILREKIIDRLEELETEKRNGGFRIPQTYAEALKLAADQTARVEQLQRQNSLPNPVKAIGTAIVPTAYPCKVSQMARMLQACGIRIGRNSLFAWLRANGYLHMQGDDYNLPTPKAVQMGLFEVKHTVIDKPDGNIAIASVVKVTAAGQLHFLERFLGNKVS